MNLVSIDKLLDDIQKRAAEVAPQGLKTGTATGGLHQDKHHVSAYVETPLSVDDLYYHAPTQKYIRPTAGNGWALVNDYGAMRFVKSFGHEGTAIDRWLDRAVLERSVSYFGPLAGCCAGKYQIGGETVLVS